MKAEEAGLVVVCRTMPPLVVGSAVLMRNLLQAYRGKLTALAGWEHGANVDADYGPVCPTHYLKFAPPLVQRMMQHRLSQLHYLLARRFVFRKLKQLRPAAVFSACTPDGIFFVASFLACRRLNIPFWGHMHDLWQENTRAGSFTQRLAKHWEPVIFREADRIFCMTEAQCEYYHGIYGGEHEIIPHCVSSGADDLAPRPARARSRDKETQILYTGNINAAMNQDALGILPAALDSLPANYRVTLLTSATPAWCEAAGLSHARLHVGWTSVAEASKRVREADILFLPLSFKNCCAAEVKTVFATKTLDYLTAGVPIVVYGPADCHHCRSAKSNGWGYVVDEDSPQALTQAVRDLARNPDLRDKLVAGAFAEARRRDPVRWAKCLQEMVESARRLAVAE